VTNTGAFIIGDNDHQASTLQLAGQAANGVATNAARTIWRAGMVLLMASTPRLPCERSFKPKQS
jgi:hypothetical protein